MSPAAVVHGTADALARVAHFRALTDTLSEAHELDPVARFLIGPVGNPAEVLEQLSDELDHLWLMLTEDYCDSDLDELTEADWDRHSFATYGQECDHRWSVTVDRLVADIEGHIALARLVHAERDAAKRRHPAARVLVPVANPRFPRRHDGGPSVSEFLRSKGEI